MAKISGVHANKDISVRARLAAGTSYVSNTGTTVLWDDKVDPLGALNLANGIFTCPLGYDGKYKIDCAMLFSAFAWALNNYAQIVIYKNGAVHKASYTPVMAANTFQMPMNISDEVDLIGGDTIYIQIFFSRTGGNTSLQNSATLNTFSIMSKTLS